MDEGYGSSSHAESGVMYSAVSRRILDARSTNILVLNLSIVNNVH